MSIATYSLYNIIVSDIAYYAIVYACHLCDASEFSNARNAKNVHLQRVELRIHQRNKKYLSNSVARKRQNIVKNYGCPSCSDHYDTINELGNHLDEKHTPKTRPEVDSSFESLTNENKWALSTGTTKTKSNQTELTLQIGELPSQSFIFDVDNSELYIKHGTITSGEIEEIMTNYNNIPLQLPDDFKHYLNKFNCKSTVDIRKALLQKESWEDSYHQDKHFDLEWIKQSIHMLLQECIGNLKGIEIISVFRGEGASAASAAYTTQLEKIWGDDLISYLEYGAAEVAKNYDLNSNKTIIERNAKLPRVLKDMLDMLLQEKKGDASNLCTFGVVHSGLYMQVISVDRPNGYITRVNEGKPLQIPIDVGSFGEKALLILVQVYHLKQLVKSVISKCQTFSNCQAQQYKLARSLLKQTN
ncbi:MAG: hypothetical protein EXX96DRAFT_540005 [Benjaminiella poitrasii]|nr:MAG: hypothetical protein EXX96DRAFT_540005 [Benjaminiella poitrasii]